MKFFKGTPPKPSPRYAKLAHDLRDNDLWVENDDFQLLDAIRDLCEFTYKPKQSEQRVDAVIAELDRAMAR